MRSIDVLFSPADFGALKESRLREATCIVLDILRATSTIVTALANGAKSIVPVQTIEQAVEFKRLFPAVLLAGEREGFRITAKLTGSIDFDLGNSPREFTQESIRDKSVVITTTNGTRALNACKGAMEILAGSFLNLTATVGHLRTTPVKDLLIVCSGTHEEASLEDALGAGAFVDALWPILNQAHMTDAAQMARMIYQRFENDLEQAMGLARNGKRLLGISDLRDDVTYCLGRNTHPVVVRMESTGELVALRQVPPDAEQ